ncbi:hypothetical protein C1645_834285 [Glomus cerebriforme]|uniref:Uncharacterized protein n=1 Tax=Glomus cerebriforme TaxID=658196 RepID=A0A397SC90_9GLOM|nr:hypothetical protein C1645_834285 [Glomus cerebriforme]
MDIPEHCNERPFQYTVFVPSRESQLTPWPIGIPVLILNTLILYPTYKWNRFSIISGLWSLISAVISSIRIFSAKKNQMVIAHSMPFSLPLSIGGSIIRLTLEDGGKNFKRRWQELFSVLNPNYIPLNTQRTLTRSDYVEELTGGSKTYYRIEENLRLISLIIDLIAMTVGVARVWEWWNLFDLPDAPYDSTLDTICRVEVPKHVPISYESICAFTISDWSDIPEGDNCKAFEPSVTSVLIILYTCIYAGVLLGVVVMRGYFIWGLGFAGSAIMIVFAGLQAGYSTDRRSVLFVQELFFEIVSYDQIISHQSLIYLWWHRNGIAKWLIQLFTSHG